MQAEIVTQIESNLESARCVLCEVARLIPNDVHVNIENLNTADGVALHVHGVKLPGLANLCGTYNDRVKVTDDDLGRPLYAAVTLDNVSVTFYR